MDGETEAPPKLAERGQQTSRHFGYPQTIRTLPSGPDSKARRLLASALASESKKQHQAKKAVASTSPNSRFGQESQHEGSPLPPPSPPPSPDLLYLERTFIADDFWKAVVHSPSEPDSPANRTEDRAAAKSERGKNGEAMVPPRGSGFQPCLLHATTPRLAGIRHGGFAPVHIKAKR